MVTVQGREQGPQSLQDGDLRKFVSPVGRIIEPGRSEALGGGRAGEQGKEWFGPKAGMGQWGSVVGKKTPRRDSPLSPGPLVLSQLRSYL